MPIAVVIQGAAALARRLRRASRDLDAKMMQRARTVALLVADHAKTQKVSGQVLKVRTGHLRRNIVGVARKVGSDIHAVIGVRALVPYGRIHELGGMSGENLQTVIPKRPYLQPSVEEKRTEIIDIFGGAVTEVVEDANRGIF
jgi:phage gpG-like protein